MRIIVDMNLSNQWIEYLATDKHLVVHWSSVGTRDSSDASIMAWAVENEHCVFTNDIDFGTLLALTKSSGPSVILIRGPRTLPRQVGRSVRNSIRQFEDQLCDGAIVTIRSDIARVRMLPLK